MKLRFKKKKKFDLFKGLSKKQIRKIMKTPISKLNIDQDFKDEKFIVTGIIVLGIVLFSMWGISRYGN